GDRLVAGAEGAHVDRFLVATGAAHGDAAAAISEARDTPLQDLAADRVDDEIDARAARQVANDIDPIGARVVDAFVHAEVVQRLETNVARRGRVHNCSGPARELDRGDAHTAGAGLDQHGLARL